MVGSRGELSSAVSVFIFSPAGVRGALWAFHLGVIRRGVESRRWRREGLSPPSGVPSGGLEPGLEYEAANLLAHSMGINRATVGFVVAKQVASSKNLALFHQHVELPNIFLQHKMSP